MIVIALGANLPSMYGAPDETLAAACDALNDRGVKVVARSPLYWTAPVPISDQPWYCNGVVSVEVNVPPVDLITLLHQIEADFGRARVEGNQNAPRALDLDLIAYHDQIIDKDGFIVPHPRMHQRAFVLKPLYDISPNWLHPVTERSAAELLGDVADQQIADQPPTKIAS
jgi:2-amino-4-hydroxy-6-hydroxymethyldihydropteridine diphosphokinase